MPKPKKQPILKITFGKDRRFYYYVNGKRTGKDEYETIRKKWLSKFWGKCYDKLGIAKKHVDAIMSSIYLQQNNDYELLKLPGDTIKYVPADYKLAGIIRKLWKTKIITEGWDQGSNDYDEDGFIAINPKTTDGKSVIPVLKKLFGKIIYTKKFAPGSKNRERVKPNLVRFDISDPYGYFYLGFNVNTIDKINEQLKIRKTNEDPLPGLATCVAELGYKPAWY